MVNDMNIYACYRNKENKWVVDGERGREVYPSKWDKSQVISAYKREFIGYECGKYNIEVYAHDIRYSKGDAALVRIDRFDGDTPLDSKSFYLPEGKDFDIHLTESDIDRIYEKKEGSWL